MSEKRYWKEVESDESIISEVNTKKLCTEKDILNKTNDKVPKKVIKAKLPTLEQLHLVHKKLDKSNSTDNYNSINDPNELENQLLSMITNENFFNKFSKHDNINLLYQINFNLLKLSSCVIKRLMELKKQKEYEINNKINLLKNDLIRLNSINYMANCFSLQNNIVQSPTPTHYFTCQNQLNNYLKENGLYAKSTENNENNEN